MRCKQMLIAIALFLALGFAQPGQAIDWKEFEDTKSIVLTDAFAKSIADLPASEKEAAMKRLQESLKSKELEIRRRVALTLDKLGDKSGVPTMIDDLSSATGSDRNNIIVALRILKDDRAIPALQKALKDKTPYVRGIAVAALGELKATKAYDDIVALTKDKGDKVNEKQPGTLNCFPDRPAEMACYALGALGDKRAVPVLIGLLDEKDIEGPAIQALEVLTKEKLGKEPEKWKIWWKRQDR
jgi:HEAT repeat protein